MFRRSQWAQLAAAMLTLTFCAHAQVNTADVLGTATDSSGSAVPNANVTIVSTETGVSRNSTSSAGGEYVFSALQVGKYTLKVEAAGFAPFEAKGITLAAGDRVRVDASLTVGQQTQTVEVSAAAAALQSDSSSVGSLITDHAVQDLPLNGRNFVSLVQLQPGVAEGLSNSMSSGNRPDDRRQSSSYSANGQTDIVNNNLIDGMDNNERFIGTIGVRPSVDAIQEVRVQTNLYPAEIGRAAGAVVDLITKSGTNSYHGTLFEFLRNDILDARDFFAAKKPELRQNQFGGSVGGPIVKDKTFFFGDYEGFRQLRGQTGTTTVPTLFEEQNAGNFSDIGGPVISPSRFDPAGLSYFKLYPTPTSSALTNNFTASPVRSQTSNLFDIKIDHHFNSNLSLFGRYSFNQVTTFTPPILPQKTINVGGGSVTAYPGDGFGGGSTSFAGNAYERQQNIALGLQDILRPNLLLELRAGYLRSYINSSPLNAGQATSTDIGFPCTAASCINVPGNSFATGLPLISINGSPYQSLGDAGFIPLTTIDNSFIYNGTLTWTRGAHNVKAGAGLNRRQLATGQSSYPRGEFFLYASNTVTGNVLGDLLIGHMATENRGNTLNFPSYRAWEPNVFAQDDWRVRKWLTLNIGLRYDVFTPLTEHHGQFSNFDQALGLLVSPSLTGVQKSSATADVQTDYGNVAPRIGFAATIPHSMVLRGGFGMTYWPGNYASGAVMKNAPFTFLYGCGEAPYSGTPCQGAFATSNGAAQLSAGLPVPVINLANATNPANYLGTGINATAFNYKSSYLEQFTLQLQKEFAGNIVTAGYVGNLGRRLVDAPNINQPSTSVSGYPFPGLPGTTLTQRQSAGISRYNSMQLTFQRRFSHGLTANVNYTFSHMITNTPVTDESQGSATNNCQGICLMDNPSNPAQPSLVRGWQVYDLGNGDLDIRHRFTALVNYELPFGSHLTGFARQAIHGWALNIVGAYQTGLPLTVLNSGNVSGIKGVGVDRPDQLASASLSNPTIHEWFNTSVFRPQTPGTLGSESRNQVVGPPQRRVDFSLFKEFPIPIREEMRLQFRAEFFNLTNTANFSQPGSAIGNNLGVISSTNPGSNPREIQFSLKLIF